jgi:hypothetical protein
VPIVPEVQANRIFQGPSRIVNASHAKWRVYPSAVTKEILSESIEFGIHVGRDDVDEEHRDLLVSGKINGDKSRIVALQDPVSRAFLCRLCTAPDHPGGPHWHWLEQGTKGTRHEDSVPSEDHQKLQDRDDFLVYFCATLNINGLNLQGGLLA